MAVIEESEQFSKPRQDTLKGDQTSHISRYVKYHLLGALALKISRFSFIFTSKPPFARIFTKKCLLLTPCRCSVCQKIEQIIERPHQQPYDPNLKPASELRSPGETHIFQQRQHQSQQRQRYPQQRQRYNFNEYRRH